MSLHAPHFAGRVSRREIALSPIVWLALRFTLGWFAVATICTAFLLPEVTPARPVALGIVLALATAGIGRMRVPEPGSRSVHGVLILIYGASAAAIWAFAPHGSAAVPVSMFTGPLVAVWVVDRRQIAAHFVGASALILLAATHGGSDQGTLVAAIVLIPAIWVLGACCAQVMELAEAQGDELEHLSRHDPLTGAGNRRDLDRRLASALDDHTRAGTELSVLSLDLNGFKALNDSRGHAAGDELLRSVTRALQGAVRSQDTVIRQGGDEFLVLLPATGAGDAMQLAGTIREQLASAIAGGGVTTGIGVATFPQDGDSAAVLLAAADARLLADKASARDRRGAATPTSSGGLSRVAEPNALSATPAPASRPRTHTGISRRGLATNRYVWFMGAGMYLYYAVVGTAVSLFTSLGGPLFPYVVGTGGLIGLGFLVSRPPEIGTRFNHFFVAVSYLVPFAILLTCAPSGSVGIGTSIFIGPLAAIKLVDRRQIAAHLAIASALMLGLIVTGQTDPSTSIGVLLLLLALWVLGACCVIVLEGAEAQGDQLEQLARRDPLTGAGNRRLLDERLAAELDRHAASGRTFAVLALDLNGFKAVNDTHGHAAGDDVLRDATAALRRAVGTGDVLVRQGGDEFCLVLPGATPNAAAGAAVLIRRCLATVRVAGQPLTTGIGVAVFPADGTTADALLATADARLIEDKRSAAPRPALLPRQRPAA